jgi:hypothetical protein
MMMMILLCCKTPSQEFYWSRGRTKRKNDDIDDKMEWCGVMLVMTGVYVCLVGVWVCEAETERMVPSGNIAWLPRRGV